MYLKCSWPTVRLMTVVPRKETVESDTGTTPETHGRILDRLNCLTPNECFDERMTLLYFVFTVIFSAQLHKAHSKVRVSTPSGPDTKPVNVIGPWHFGHGGRAISIRSGLATRDCGMCCPPKIRREHDALSHR